MKLRVREVDEQGREPALAFARAERLGRALLLASLEQGALRKHARHWLALRGETVVGLVGQIDGVFPCRSVPIASALPGVAAQLLAAPEPPYECLVAEPSWRAVERAGAVLEREHLQMGRLQRRPLPPPDPQVVALEDADELGAFLGSDFSPALLELGPFFGARDERGALLAAAGVEFVTDELAQLALVHTSESHRRQGRARAVVVELLRALENERRRVILQVRADNEVAIALYAELGFRGTRRLSRFSFPGST